MIYFLVLSAIGWTIGFGIFEKIKSDFVLLTPYKFQVMFAGVTAVVAAIFGAKFTLFVLAILLLASASLSAWVNGFRRKQKFLELQPQLIDELLLNLKLGQSLRDAMRTVLQQKSFRENEDFANLGRDLLQVGAITDPGDFLEKKFLTSEIKVWDSRPVKVVQQVESFRQQLKTKEHIAQKIKAVTGQPRGQMLIVVALYLVCGLVLLIKVPMTPIILACLTVSIGTFAAGISLFFYFLRSFKWSV